MIVMTYEDQMLIEQLRRENAETLADMQRRREARERGETREWTSPPREQPAAQQVVYKTFDPARAQQARNNPMDQETADSWNKWLDSHLAKFANDFGDEIIKWAMEEINVARDDGRKARLAAVSELKAEIEKLRGEMATMKTAVAAQRSGVQRPRTPMAGRHASPPQH